jgi:uncharacterized protein (TIGR03083 family)
MTASCHRAAASTYCDDLTDVIARLANVTAKLDPATRVPTCPDWNIGDLTSHVGGVHRWAVGNVAALAQERIPSAKLGIDIPEDPAARPQWLADGAPRMVEVFRRVDPAAPMWAWGSDKHARFWPRRMIHETTVHRADAEFAAGFEPEIERSLAVDGIDEFLDNLPHATYFAPRVEELRGTGEQVVLRPNDAEATWTITLNPDRFSWDHSEAAGDASVEGGAVDLYLFVWGRRKPADASRFKIEGDRALLDFWVERAAI